VIPNLRDSIHLAACSKNENLPMHPELPLDIFTACLTTPIAAALHWYVSQKNLCQLVPGLTVEMLEQIPGSVNDRRTMMGELNWIFTAITDTIAWNVLDSELFQKLFRQDLLVASLFRNYLLAERIMKSLDCTPVSHPPLPTSTDKHPLWQSWDLALDIVISQLPSLIVNSSIPPTLTMKEFVSSGFFTEQIEIFDVWLRYNVDSHSPPEQLPIILQVLLSQQHRIKAMELLAKFIDFGPWAVSAALSVGIFPYVLKLLYTNPKELRPLLTFIWAKIFAVDKTCQNELIKDNGHTYFLNILEDTDVDSTHKAYAAFALSCIVDNCPQAQESTRKDDIITKCIALIDYQNRDYQNSLLRQWACICLGLCWEKFPQARSQGERTNVHRFLIELIYDPVPEVRTAAIFALGTYIDGSSINGQLIQNNSSSPPLNESTQSALINTGIISSLLKVNDIVYIVRMELIIVFQYYINNLKTNYQDNHSSSSISNNSSIINDNELLNTSSNSSSLISSISSTGTLTNTPNNSLTSPTHSLISPITPASGMRSSPSSRSLSGISVTTSMSSSGVSSSTSTTSSRYSSRNLFNVVWDKLEEFTADPHNDVATLAKRVISYFLTELRHFDTHKRDYMLSVQRLSSKTKLQIHQTPTMTIKTEFVGWCRRYFLKPLLSSDLKSLSSPSSGGGSCSVLSLLSSTHKTPEIDVYTTEFLSKHCKSLYNHKVKRRIPGEWHTPQQMESVFQLKHPMLPVHCKFHQYEDQLFVIDKDCMINIYDIQTKTNSHTPTTPTSTTPSNSHHPVVTQLKLKFPNIPNDSLLYKNQRVITSFKIINAQHEPIFLTGTDHRVVRIFKPDLVNFRSEPKLLTAFNAFGQHEKKRSSIESGLIVDWEDYNETLLCAGDTGQIRAWDMNKELFIDHFTHVQSCVSCLTADRNCIIAGFGDGTVKMFDTRMANNNNNNSNNVTSNSNNSGTNINIKSSNIAQSNVLYQLQSYALKVKLHGNKLITASTSGDVNILDIRNLKYLLTSPINNEPAFAVECHPINELIAV
jgi:regulatory associated protein of mTOR